MSYPSSADEPWAALTKTAPPLQPPSPHQPEFVSTRTEHRSPHLLDFVAPALQASPPAPGQVPWKHVSWPWSRLGQASAPGGASFRSQRPAPPTPDEPPH